ncbi:histidine kinase N-terminal 7TM domain-containing protein [Cohnella rhizosphaerae]|uniref:histidine kinase n=1 Tax=Cohnella rhizosphaerae TaxID=1457232 RepID=A0A9X4KUZ5_9BACL|nr:histidine kinase N-terminal 7TM domain-containing protein [Cohnella rhizosphaerae]MDG0811412.1 PAS domain S-box protein [Cohnella rhizosphaerae]
MEQATNKNIGVIKRTGAYRKGRDRLLVNAKGDSYVEICHLSVIEGVYTGKADSAANLCRRRTAHPERIFSLSAARGASLFMNFNLYLSALLIASTGGSAVVVYLCWKRRELPIALSYGLCILSTAFYTFGYASELVSTSLDTIRFWLRIEYIGIPFGTVFWFIMVLQYTGRQAYIRKWSVVAAMVIPVMTFIAHNTNEWHHLFYRSLTLDYSEGFPLARIVRGPLYYVHVVYAYALILVGVVLLFRMYFKSAPAMKKHVVLMLIGSLAPYSSTLVYLSEALPTPFDISPFGFFLSNIFFLFGIYQFNLLRLAPMALQKVFESMQDAVVLLDLEHNITGFNQAAGRTIQGLSRKKGIGQPASVAFASNPELLRRIDRMPGTEDNELLRDEAAGRYYSLQVSFIADFRSRPAGKMLLLRDVTDAVRSEEQLIENARQLRELNAFKDQMFNVVAHDIRDPMAVLLNLTELLEEEASVCGGGSRGDRAGDEPAGAQHLRAGRELARMVSQPTGRHGVRADRAEPLPFRAAECPASARPQRRQGHSDYIRHRSGRDRIRG